MKLEFHELANLFPLMEGREFDDLVTDIELHGCREPIYLLDGKILDGRNRWRACEKIGARPTLVDYEGDDAAAFVISLNLHRRHLSESQRMLVAGKLANLRDGQRADQAAQTCAPVTQSAAAEMLNVSRRGVQLAREVIDHGSPELVAAVEQGRVSVSAASDVSSLPKGQQSEIVARGEKEILQAAKEIRGRKLEARREVRIETIRAASVGDQSLPDGRKYPVLYADPPWRYEHVETESRAIENQYPTMALDDICALPVSQLALDDAVLFLWATSPKLAEAMRVIESWGFTYRTCAVWAKPQIGMGYYFRQQHELLLVAARGSLPTPAPADRPGSVITADRTKHSAKPAEFAAVIEAMYPTLPKIELFCRSPRDGWAVWGNQSAA